MNNEQKTNHHLLLKCECHDYYLGRNLKWTVYTSNKHCVGVGHCPRERRDCRQCRAGDMGALATLEESPHRSERRGKCYIWMTWHFSRELLGMSGLKEGAVHTPSYLSKIHLNIIHPPTSWSS
jgi:hypothetical protein